MPDLPAPVTAVATVALGAALWTLAEYLLHRFAMHHLGGRGIMSREHLEHHVHSTWHFDRIALLSWAGVFVTGYLVWLPIGWALASPGVGVALGTGWVLGYAFYELQHALAHRRAPRGRYSTFVRRHHFHHHFGHPMANHGVTTGLWDRVFGTFEDPGVVRVPRRLALPWLLDEDGALLERYEGHYELVGSPDPDERQASLDRIRAFASLAPTE